MKNAIIKAIEGGYDCFINKSGYPQQEDNVLMDCEITSNPLFWQALGKAMGWEMRKKCCEGCGSKEKLIDGEYHLICSSCHREGPKLIPEWLFHWHRFIDHLAEGKDAESFFNELLK